MKTEESLLSLPVGAGLLFILAFLSLCVYATPPPKPPPDPELFLGQHQSLAYGIDAEMMAQRLFNDPSAGWPFYKSGPMCVPIGRGVWYAIGPVDVPTQQSPFFTQLSWEVCFLPESQTCLYARVGGIVSGDVNAALQRAGRTAPKESAPHDR